MLTEFSQNRVSIDKYDKNTVLSVRKAVRADSGKYKLVLTNTSGTCEGIAEVVVLGESDVLFLLNNHSMNEF